MSLQGYIEKHGVIHKKIYNVQYVSVWKHFQSKSGNSIKFDVPLQIIQ